MSMFRRPGDSSSSSDEEEESYNHTTEDEESYDQATEDEERSGPQQDSVLSRINTLDSTTSGGPAARQTPPRLEVRQSSSQNVRDLLLHSLLEEKTLTQAAEQLGKDRSDPDVQKLSRKAYQEISRQISNNVDDTYASEDMRGHRATAQEGISRLTKSNLSRLAVIPERASQALVTLPSSGLAIDLPYQPTPEFHILSGLTVPAELQLRGYPGLQTDRYAREFSELEIVGKGGYGKVFKARHKLDGSFYAVKRIPVSPAKVAKIQEHGPQELESMLEEVRSLARFDHTNVVRYHNAWLEFTTAPAEVPVIPTATVLRDDRLLEDPAAFPSSSAAFDNIHPSFDNLAFDDPFAKTQSSHGADIVFESSDQEFGAEEPKNADDMPLKEKLKHSSRKTRRASQASQATIATMSTVKSRKSAVGDVDEQEEDDEIELIPRSHMPYAQEPTSDLSESMVSHSDVPGHLVSVRSSGPTLMLNVQMSLCETNLAAFLSSDILSSDTRLLNRHCFHSCVSIELLSNIVSGVEYLHEQGVVHRDLKPANIFLSVSNARYPPYGSVDIAGCKPCPKRDCLHITPRIGDFGLVAALSDQCTGTEATAKPVGTEFYRPQSSNSISEKLDVYALGVLGFEMLHPFSTRMERVAALTGLRRGQFPEDFALRLGDLGDKIPQLIGYMVEGDEQKRLGCDEVRREIAKLVQVLKM